jgi:uncharacterized spore protein YtfJ
MKLDELLGKAGETFTARRVYAEPYERDGVTVIPAARVNGGSGGGSGHDTKGQDGEGGGYGISSRPAGAYVIKNGEVSWRPAFDPNRMVLMVGAAVVAYLLMRPRVIRARAATRALG